LSMQNNRPGFAIVGCGKISRRHAVEASKFGQLIAVCDIIPEKADALSREISARSYYSLSELLKDQPSVEIVSVCTPNGLHAQHAIEAMQAGRHVLCEKPMAIRATEAKNMIRVSRETRQKLFIVKQNRFNPPVVFVRSLLQRKGLGDISGFQLNCYWNRPSSYYENSWHGTLELDGGILLTQFSHFIDLIYWFFGDIQDVKGFRSNYFHREDVSFEDSGVAIIRLKNGVMGTVNYTINSYLKNMEGSLTIFGERGTVKIGGQYLNTLEYFNVDGLEQPTLPISSPSNEYGYYQGSMSNHDKVYETMINAIEDPSVPFVTMEEGLKTVEIIEKIYQHSPLI
jgi:UDP-N-acetyl-2-amino-2-deoxyglucuronate dehydrogenase